MGEELAYDKRIKSLKFKDINSSTAKIKYKRILFMTKFM